MTHKNFNVQHADFEEHSHSSETASEGRQPSYMQRSNPFAKIKKETGMQTGIDEKNSLKGSIQSN